MDAEQSIAEIERLERIFAVPDTRPLSASDLAAANRRHDDLLGTQPVVSPLAAVRRLLPLRVPSNATTGGLNSRRTATTPIFVGRSLEQPSSRDLSRMPKQPNAKRDHRKGENHCPGVDQGDGSTGLGSSRRQHREEESRRDENG